MSKQIEQTNPQIKKYDIEYLKEIIEIQNQKTKLLYQQKKLDIEEIESRYCQKQIEINTKIVGAQLELEKLTGKKHI